MHTLDQLVGQASRLGWTVGVTSEDLVGAQCRTAVGLGGAKTNEWKSGAHMKGVWYQSSEDAAAHQQSMHCVPDGRYQALAVGPLGGGKLVDPDIALFYATPGAMIYFINGLQWTGYKRFDWSVVGKSACADSWGRALSARLPSLSIPCFAERRYGGVLDDETLLAAPPEFLLKAIEGIKALSKNGFRYPFPQFGVQQDVRAVTQPPECAAPVNSQHARERRHRCENDRALWRQGSLYRRSMERNRLVRHTSHKPRSIIGIDSSMPMVNQSGITPLREVVGFTEVLDEGAAQRIADQEDAGRQTRLLQRAEPPDRHREDGEQEHAFERGFIELARMNQRHIVDRPPRPRGPVIDRKAHRPRHVGRPAVEFAVDEVGDAVRGTCRSVPPRKRRLQG